MLLRTRVTPNIFDYTDAVSFLRDLHATRRRNNPRFSLRAWSKQLGMRNPSTLSRILKGDREIGLRLIQELAKGLKLSDAQKRYFELLVLMKRTGADYSIQLNAIKATERKERKANLSADQFAFIAEWYHIPILEMTALSDFEPDPSWISARLGGAISPQLCEEALQRLKRLGLIQVTSDQKIQRFSDETVMGGDWGIPSKAVREFHKKMIEKAIHAIEHQSVEQRILEGLTVSLRIKDIPLAKEIIREANQRLSQLSVTGGADEVYQISTQLFQLTTRSSAELC